jgi:gluconate 2-dehydrogenase gamma chain
MNLSRREWLLGSLTAGGFAEIAAAREHARQAVAGGAAPRFEYFDEATAADVEALAAEILPSGDGPGAKEAGVVYFIDRALHTFDAEQQDVYRAGMREIRETRDKLFPDAASIAALTADQRLALVRAIEHTGFFEVVRVHTLLGFLGDPSYGGNREKRGWNYIGFEDRMAWEPPFGYYDTEAK